MILIIGGSYNGKLDYVVSKYKMNTEDIYDFSKEKFDINILCDIVKKYQCLYNIHILIKEIIRNNINMSMLYKIFDSDMNNIIISDDISCGVVPIDSFNREYREEVSKFITYISKNAKEVYRVYAGLPQKIK